MAKTAVFQYKIPRQVHAKLPTGKAEKQSTNENLTGFIGSQKASDIEERFYRSLVSDGHVTGISFRLPVIAARGVPGQLEIDFVVTARGFIFPFQVDGEYAHKNTSKALDDAKKDVLVNNYMKQYGALPVKRIPGDLLQKQSDSDHVVRELFL
jgi:hypothetical protein